MRFWFREGMLKEKIKDLKNISPLVNGTLVDGLIRSNADGKEDNGNMIWKLFALNKVIQIKPSLEIMQAGLVRYSLV